MIQLDKDGYIKPVIAPRDILQAAYSLLEVVGWSRGSMGKFKDGRKLQSSNMSSVKLDELECCCVEGAMRIVCGNDQPRYTAAAQYLQTIIHQAPHTWNDTVAADKLEVLGALSRAVEQSIYEETKGA